MVVQLISRVSSLIVDLPLASVDLLPHLRTCLLLEELGWAQPIACPRMAA